MNGIKTCAEHEYPPTPSSDKNCQEVEKEGNCCPEYECDDITRGPSEEDVTICTSRQPNQIGVTDIVSGPGTTLSDSDDIENLPETVEAVSQTTEMNQKKDDEDIEEKDKGNIISNIKDNLTTPSSQTTSKAKILDDGADDDYILTIYFAAKKTMPMRDGSKIVNTLADRNSENDIMDNNSEDCQLLPKVEVKRCPDQFECSK